MIVFISDLHLNQQDVGITQRFDAFITWASERASALYILGDFFHAWPGDDALDAWSEGIAARLAWLASTGVAVFFMHGNRDFLLGERFAQRAGFHILPDPSVIVLDNQPILLSHGDRYCTLDRAHQRFRRVTRHTLFRRLFLQIPYAVRARIVTRVRQQSQTHRNKPAAIMDVVPSSVTQHLRQWRAGILIHGHTHKPGLSVHVDQGMVFQRYVLSDWDDIPEFLCYDKTTGFYFNRFSGGGYG